MTGVLGTFYEAAAVLGGTVVFTSTGEFFREAGGAGADEKGFK